jgi:glutathione S-transferase
VHHPDITPTFEILGIPGNESWPHHTLVSLAGRFALVFTRHHSDDFFHFHREQPIVNIPGHGLVQDSGEIAKALEAKYPTPPIHLSDGTVQAAIELTNKLAGACFFFLLPKVPVRLLQDYDAQYYYHTREKQFGKSLKQIEAETDQAKVMANVNQIAKEVVALLNKQGGPFFLGKTRWSPPPFPLRKNPRLIGFSRPTASYGDLYLVAFLAWSVSRVINCRMTHFNISCPLILVTNASTPTSTRMLSRMTRAAL